MSTPALIFDLDGTLVDSVYQHVLAWHEALQEAGVELAVWRIHRRIGMSGGLLTRALLRETGRALDEALLVRMQDRHTEAYRRRIGEVRALPGRAPCWRGSPSSAAPSRSRPAAGWPPPARRSSCWPCRTASRSSPVISCLTPNPTPICSSKPCASSALTSSTLWWSATACGTCLPRGARTLGMACCPAATAPTSWSAPGRIGCTTTPDLLDHLDEIGVRPERMVPG